jgi:Cu/Ag efflux protein CusF
MNQGKRARFLLGTMVAKDKPASQQTLKIMKTTMIKKWTAVGAAVLAASAAFRASADPSATPARPERSYTGTVVSVDPQERTLRVSQWALSKKTFNLGDNCTYALLFTTVENNRGTVNDLRPGEKVTISYQVSHGVLIADRIQQQPVRFEGMVKAIAPDKHTLTLHRRGLDKKLAIADGCLVVLRNEKPGTFADIHPGDHVTVTCETPGGTPTVREIAQTSLAFAGTLTAIDLGEKTVKARALFDTKKFNVADNCTIVIAGKTDGKLSDLKPNDQLVFTYEPINGVNVVNRIGPASVESQNNSTMVTTPPMGYPTGF